MAHDNSDYRPTKVPPLVDSVTMLWIPIVLEANPLHASGVKTKVVASYRLIPIGAVQQYCHVRSDLLAVPDVRLSTD
ncbi:hypothetical protein VCV18_004063 [Metarhizium anisopliae]